MGQQFAIIARTQEKESCSEDGVFWWKEWAVKKSICGFKWELLVRYLCRYPTLPLPTVCVKGNSILNPATDGDGWEIHDTGKTRKEAIRGSSDGSYMTATSLDEDHATAMQDRKVMQEANRAKDIAEKQYQNAVNAMHNFRCDQTRRFTKRHGEKTGEAFDKARAKTLARIKPEMDALQAEIDATKTRMETTTKIVGALWQKRYAA